MRLVERLAATSAVRSALPGHRPAFLSDETFMRGLALGAVIGAAIAGSTLWTRARRGSRAAAHRVPSPRRSSG